MDFEEEVVHDPNGETLTLEATMQPLLLESMTKSKDGFLGVRKQTLPSYRRFIVVCADSVENCCDESQIKAKSFLKGRADVNNQPSKMMRLLELNIIIILL